MNSSSEEWQSNLILYLKKYFWSRYKNIDDSKLYKNHSRKLSGLRTKNSLTFW
jgi:hypothetical protein